MKGTLYTYKEYYEKTKEQKESKNKWIHRFIDSGLIKATWRHAYRLLKNEESYIFVSGKTVIHLNDVAKKKAPSKGE